MPGFGRTKYTQCHVQNHIEKKQPDTAMNCVARFVIRCNVFKTLRVENTSSVYSLLLFLVLIFFHEVFKFIYCFFIFMHRPMLVK